MTLFRCYVLAFIVLLAFAVVVAYSAVEQSVNARCLALGYPGGSLTFDGRAYCITADESIALSDAQLQEGER
jgi:hypothetical protein